MSDRDERGGGGGGAPPTISYTRKRTTTKTRNAASSARRRKNIPLVHGVGGGGGGGADIDAKDPRNSWFARKSAGWTDREIQNHIVSGGTTEGGASFSMVGDMIQGAAEQRKEKKKRKRKRPGVKRFAWEEDGDDNEDDGEEDYYAPRSSREGNFMAAAPTVEDIMDEQDKLDFMSPLKVGNQYQMNDSGQENNVKSDPSKSKKDKNSRRQKNAALAELAQVSGVDHGGGGRPPTSANDSIGSRLLRVCGYRSRLGMAFVPLSGHSGGSIVDEVAELEEKEGTKVTHEAKWLASKRLRAVYLPSIRNVDIISDNNDSTTTPKQPPPQSTSKKNKFVVLTIPPPKLNRHGIGYDPFKNAPEFRAFHEKRRELAQRQGRGTEDDAADAKNKNGKRGGGDRYFTNDVKGGRRRLWDKHSKDEESGDEDDDNDSVDNRDAKGRSQHAHYAADRNYMDFIGTKASSGFALEDEDDANVYHDGEGHDAFPRGDVGDGRCGGSEYAMEVQSPVASDEEDNALDGGLFGKAAAMIESKRKVAEKRAKGNKLEDKGQIADVWSAWGVGTGSETNATLKTTTMDGKPPLPGFNLGQSNNIPNQQNNKPGCPKRYKGPIVPSGYILKRHVFPTKDDNLVKESLVDRTDSGLGLNLQEQTRQQKPRSIPRVLPPPSSDQQKQQRSEKMLAKDGTELNFHAVRESMKNRFVSSSGTADAQKSAAPANNDDVDKEQNIAKEEWVQVHVTPWVPTRLLCKRWGVPAPSTAGMSMTGGVVMGIGKESKEENYFRQTVYEPAVAAQRQNGTEKSKDSNNGAKESISTSIVQDGISVEEGDAGPPPDRPSNDVFQSIFDAESDMDISSSEDEGDEDELEQEDLNASNQIKIEKEKEVDVKPTVDDKADVLEGTALKDRAGDTITNYDHPSKQMDNQPAPSAEGSVSSSSLSSRQRDSRRRDADRKRRKKEEKHRRKHHRRRHDSDSESDQESQSDDSGHRRRRRRSQKHKHRSHSRHKRNKHSR